MSPPAVPQDARALVAIDLGAESCRVSLLRWLAGAPRIELVHRFPNNAAQRPDGLRWNLQSILSQLDTGLRLCAERAPEGIRSIAVDGWAVDYVRLDPHTGMATADPFCYRDPRTQQSEAWLHARISAERMRELTGIQLLPLNTVYQMAADDEASRKLRWLNLPEYVLYTLGARPVAEFTNATHTEMLGTDGEWSEEILQHLGAPLSSMPKVVAPGTQIGFLQTALRELPGFAAGTALIAPACHDTASAIAAIPDGGEDWAYISSGTWSLVGTLVTQRIDTLEARADNFTNFGGVDGTICFHKNINGMWLLRHCLETWNASKAGASLPWTIAALVEAASGCQRTAYTLDVDSVDLLLPGRMPERINAQLCQRGLPEFDTSPAAAPKLAAFIFQSLAARYAEVLTKVSAQTGKRLRKLYVMGGGSQNHLLNRMTAEATGLTVICAGTECSTTGNFAAQLATLERLGGVRPTAMWATLLTQCAYGDSK